MKKLGTYNIITIGCQMNKSDSERVAGYLQNYGLLMVGVRKKADLIIINTCGVRQSAEDRVYGLVPKIKKENKQAKIVITGCLSLREDVQKRLEKNVDIWLPIVDLPKLAEKLSLKMNTKNYTPRPAKCGTPLLRGDLKCGDYLNIRPEYKSKISAFVPIGNGCNNFCTYCVVPYARGREVYRPTDEIINEVKKLVENGYKEIVLIAQNVNSYKSPLERGLRGVLSRHKTHPVSGSETPLQRGEFIDFSDLLKMVNDIPGDFWIRFATSHPKDMSDELIKTVAECEKVCHHIHLPAQAGDNRIIKAMNRHYTRGHYIGLIKKIRQAMPDASITTDIIVGFPGETKQAFNNTAKLFREIKYDMAYIAQYSPRSGTAAAKLVDDVEKKEKKNREEELMKILRKTALENNKNYIGQEVEVLIFGKSKDGKYFGYTQTNKNVKIANFKEKNAIGKIVKVKIISAQDFGLEGEIAEKKKVIVIVGTTSSGKTKLGVKMARKYNGEIISADSRQVYKGMDVGTGKDLKEYKIKSKIKNQKSKITNIPYHLIDVADPKETFDLAQWYKMAQAALSDIIDRGKMPIVVGGAGLYAQALVDGYSLSDVKPDDVLRKKLEKKNKEELFEMLKKINSVFVCKLNNSEKNNKRRLIRYIEILNQERSRYAAKKKNNKYDFEIFGLTYPREELKQRIYKRLMDRLEKEDMVGEVRGLHKRGLSWEKMESFGLEYKFVSQYLQKKLSYDEMVKKLYIATCQYAKRQMTWLKRWEKQGAKINWISK